MSTTLTESQPSVRHPSFREAFRFWLKLGLISFGGPTGQIAIMQTELVERKRWISQSRFLHALNFCMLLPGPEAQQLAIYVGWLLHKTWGGIVAGAFFVIPSIFILWTLSFIYAAYGNVPWIAAIFYGLKPAVTAIGDEEESPPHAQPNLARAFRVSVLWLALWLTPTLIVGAVRGWESTLFKESLFFSKAAVVTFGGAYAVLPYVAQQALSHYG